MAETIYATGSFYENRTALAVIIGQYSRGTIKNYAGFVTIKGASSSDITNYFGQGGVISVTSGDNKITNRIRDVLINCSSPGKNTISNEMYYSENVTIISGSGDDSIKNEANNVSIYSGDGNNTITNWGSNVTINAGSGNDTIENTGSEVTIVSGTGNDSIVNTNDKVIIDAGAGNNTIESGGSLVTILGGSGNDIIVNTGATVTIDGGQGNDKIYNGAAPNGGGVAYYNADYYDDSFSNVVFKHKAGDGNHAIWGFRENSTLEVEGVEPTDISYLPDATGNNINVTIGNAQVSLFGSGPNGDTPVTNLNISVPKTGTLICDVERNIFESLSLDVERNILGEINLFATSEEISNNASDVQSFSIQIAEQQLTDQIIFTGLLPYSIMEQIEGQYFDYKYQMRVESITQSGALYTCYCCSDVDERLYELLNYKIPEVDDKYKDWFNESDIVTNADADDAEEEGDVYPLASVHLWNIAEKLLLEPVCRIFDFFSTVDTTIAGVTYCDLIRSIFGWTARVPPHMINVFIRDNKLYAIQRGLEEHIIDISNAKISQPVFQYELVRTSWGETPYIDTEVRTVTTYTTTPVYEGIDKAKVQPLASDTRQDIDGTTTINYSYDSDGMLIKTEEISPTSRTVTTHKYITGANGNKFLSQEETTVYDLDGNQIDYRSVKHSPTNYGQAAVTAGNGDSENIVSTVKNVPYDERPTPYALGQQLKALISEPSGTQRQKRLVPGIVDFDTSFPVFGDSNLYAITNAIRYLNRTTKETVTLSLYDYSHIIDFNDRIILNDVEYFLKSNKVVTTPRIFNQQNLTLVRWIGYDNDWQELDANE